MTIQCNAIESPSKVFYCQVLRAPCYNVLYRTSRWETWNVLAETLLGALRVSRYHFFSSSLIVVTSTKPKFEQKNPKFKSENKALTAFIR